MLLTYNLPQFCQIHSILQSFTKYSCSFISYLIVVTSCKVSSELLLTLIYQLGFCWFIAFRYHIAQKRFNVVWDGQIQGTQVRNRKTHYVDNQKMQTLRIVA